MTAEATGAAPSRKRASVHTLGCRLNQSESAIIAEQLRAQGYELVPFGETADLGIINTCTVTGEADSKSRQLVRAFVRKNPDAYTAVIGCYAQMGFKAISEIEGVDLIVGNQEKLNVLAYAAQGKNNRPVIVRDRIDCDDFTIEVVGDAPVSRRANLKIQDGCDFMCSFCIIPFARGRARSREFANLLEEARQLAGRGAKELVLTGVNVGTYDYAGNGILDVIDALNEIPGIERIRISSIEPTTIPDGVFDRMNDEAHALVPYLHIPMQSGSNKVLGLMKRRYTREEFVDFINHAQAAVPDLCIGTDIMVGMPGECDDAFAETVALLEHNPVRYAHAFTYSERAGTASVKLAGKVDSQTMNRRSAIIRRISAGKREAFYKEFSGREMDVLFECEENGYWTGYTGNFIRVAVRSSSDMKNIIETVRLEQLCGDLMEGTLVSEALVSR
ncbi:MAG: tRNA (N(6)-L-threonylcarbamoyladenosine(37)-C(2))-methylthiotransferase MtaB [Candidatus Hydrogenedentes bacterium]|nr:tRNA (N(6)-L-threonylcarbamoyladenosine(37)-C(2))-methylthiotransferase MtaB [Candidatus Hydrogenedentota bacterium]